MYFKGLKVLVAGGTGMIGIPLVRMLIEQGAEVSIASLDDPARANPEARFTRLDLTSLENCRRVCRGQEFVFNLLGVKGSPAITTTRPGSFFYNTLMLSLNMLEAARLENVDGFLFTSSVGVYSPAEVFYEDDVWRTFPSEHDRFPGWAKRMAELQTEGYRIQYGWDRIAVVRPANVYGPFDNFEGQNAMVVPSLIKRALSGENPMPVWGDGSPRRDFIHAEDVARGMLAAAEKMPEQPINLGSGQGRSIRELVEIILANLDEPPEIFWDADKPSGDLVRIMDISRARALGWEPEISLEAGVKSTMDWFAAHRKAALDRYDIFG